MRSVKKTMRQMLFAAPALLLAVPGLAAAAPRRSADVCALTTSPLNVFVFQDVASLAPGRSIPLHGIYFNGGRRVTPFTGSAAMASDGSVRLGIFVHSSAAPSSAGTFLNDFTLSGIADASFAGTLNFDNDGDFLPNGTLTLESVDCGTIAIP